MAVELLERTDHETRRDVLVGRLFEAAIGAMDLMTIYVGDRLGLYAGVAALGAATPAELAAHTGTNPRYVREWLEQQAVTGLLSVDDVSAAPAQRRYALPAGHDEVLLHERSLSYLGGVARCVVGVGRPLDALLTAFRQGGGVPYPAYGEDTREGIAAMNRPLFHHLLGSEWLPAVPDVHARLQAAPPARVADMGCGVGWSSIALARAYPNVVVDGYDVDEASIARARANAAEAGLADRVRFHLHDAAHPTPARRYDLVTAFETVHDMARPVEALRHMRDLVIQGGAVIVADERVGEEFQAPGDDIERLNYGFSVLHCLAVGLAEEPSVGTGTVMRPHTLREYAAAAGYRRVEVLPIENDLWRFYRLVG